MTEKETLYKVFVSSTYLDNEARRNIVQDVITTAGMVWHGMELFTAATRPTVDECEKHAREADVLVGIIAGRYGWIPQGRSVSITEIEYDAARERLMFLIDEDKLTLKDMDEEVDRWDKQKQLDAFKRKFKEDQMPTVFEDATLGHKVQKALLDWKRDRETADQKTERKPSKRSAGKRASAFGKEILTFPLRASQPI